MELSENQKKRIDNINEVVLSISMLGIVGGIIYAKKTGGEFWRYVGWGFVGSFIGVPAQIIALPFKNKIIAESESVDNLI
jgi:hypothetical protein